MASTSITCFICVSPSSLIKGPNKLTRKNKKQENDIVKFNENLSFLLKLLVSTRDSNSGAKFSGESIYEDLKQLIRDASMINPNPLEVCTRCNQLAMEVRKLYLELEVIQMKLISRLREAREGVINSSVISNLDNLKDGDEYSGDDDSFHYQRRRFQSFLLDNDVTGDHIPLIYLGRLQLPMEMEVTKHKTILDGFKLASSSVIKAEPLELKEEYDVDATDFTMTGDDFNDDITPGEEFIVKQEATDRRFIMASTPIACFICANPSSLIKGPSKLRSNREVLTDSVKFNENLSFLLKLLVSTRDSSSGAKPSGESIYEDLKQLIGDASMINPDPLEVCTRCNQLAMNVRKLYLELEVIQMKLIGKLREAREGVINSRVTSNPGNLEDGDGNSVDVDSFHSRIRRFQSFLLDNDVTGDHIPLIYLRRLQLPKEKEETTKQGAAILDGFKLASSSVIKAEPLELKEEYDVDEADFTMTWDDFKVDFSSGEEFVVIKQEATGGSQDRNEFKKSTPPPSAKKRRSRVVIHPTSTKSPTRKEHSPKEVTGLSGAQHLVYKLKLEKKVAKNKNKKLKREDKIKQGLYNSVCDLCSFTTGTIAIFEQHLRTHETDSEKPFECPDCQERFSQKQYFEFHLTLHTNIRRTKCELCEKLLFRLDLKEHYLTSHEKAYPCENCTHCFSSAINLAKHSVYHKEPKLTCNECSPPTIIKSAVSFLRHLVETHNHEELLISCSYPDCSEKFLHEDRFQHWEKHKMRHACSYCDMRYWSIATLRRHISFVHERGNTLHVCDICDMKFPKKWTLQRHKVAKHNFPPTLKCELCNGKEFARRSALATHMKKAHSSSQRGYFCSVEGCKSTNGFWSKAELKYHQECHSAEKNFMCELCEYRSKTKAALRKHRAQVHSEKRNHACSHCDKRFKSKRELTDHVRTHTGEKPFLCSECGAAFTQNSALGVHKRKVHQSDKHVPCSSKPLKADLL